jgi:Ca2+-binding RTX toxin-like protein
VRTVLVPTVALTLVLAASAGAGPGTRNTITGSPGPDTLLGTKAPDLIVGGAGHDELYGGRGGDVLHGGAGKDHLYGGDGSDFLVGGPPDDPWPVDPPFRRERLLGGAGNDFLVTHIGGAVVLGGNGNDTIDGRDRLTRCHVRAARRMLESGGPLCAQWLFAGRGDDLIRARDGNLDMISCGGGDDVVAGADAIDQVLDGCERVRR